jgi:uncharacterized protein (DUF2147 family)
MRVSFAVFGLALLALPAHAQSADPSGTWLTESGDTRVRIAQCGAAYCGTIVSSTHKKDENNQDAKLRDRSIVGVQMMWDIKPSGDGYSGQLYNPQDGKTYTGKLKVTAPDTLLLSGCVFGGLICRSQNWSRAK